MDIRRAILLLLGVSIFLTPVFAQSPPDTAVTSRGSVGVTAGAQGTTSENFGSATNGSYGGWVDFGRGKWNTNVDASRARGTRRRRVCQEGRGAGMIDTELLTSCLSCPAESVSVLNPRPGRRRIPQLAESRRKEFLRDRRCIPRQRPLGRGIIEVPRNYMNVEVRHDIAEQQIVEMTGFENAFDGPSDILNVRPVMGQFVWRKIGEGRDMSAPKHYCHMAGSYGVPFKKSFADSAAVE